MGVALVDLSIGAELLTNSELVFGKLIGDQWVDVVTRIMLAKNEEHFFKVVLTITLLDRYSLHGK